MSQQSMFKYIPRKDLLADLKPNTSVVDLFCGIGGFSCGAEAAGHRVVLAIDSDPSMLACHARNFPACQHICCNLPSDDPQKLPLPDGDYHLHASPPCQRVCPIASAVRKIGHTKATAADEDEGLEMVFWFLGLVIAKRPRTWSLEESYNKRLNAKLNELKVKHPLLVDFEHVDCVNFGVPQNRKRLIAGSPCIINNLRGFKRPPRVSLRDVIPVPPRNYIGNCITKRTDKHGVQRPVPLKHRIRSVDKPSYAIMATGHTKWVDNTGKVLRFLNADEKAILQTFPLSFKLPPSKVDRERGVGNAVPPTVATIMMMTNASSGWTTKT